jgi:hypothetical protein
VVVAAGGPDVVTAAAADDPRREVHAHVDVVLALADVDAQRADPRARAQRPDDVAGLEVDAAGAAVARVQPAEARGVHDADLPAALRDLDRAATGRRRRGGAAQPRRAGRGATTAAPGCGRRSPRSRGSGRPPGPSRSWP